MPASRRTGPSTCSPGVKTLYVFVKDGLGNVSRASDTIVLDTKKPRDGTLTATVVMPA